MCLGWRQSSFIYTGRLIDVKHSKWSIYYSKKWKPQGLLNSVAQDKILLFSELLPTAGKKNRRSAFQAQPLSDKISLTLYVYIQLWVVIYPPRACNSMFFPFLSSSEHQECPFTSFPVCFVYLSTLNRILWPGRESRWGCILVSEIVAAWAHMGGNLPEEKKVGFLLLFPKSSPRPRCLLKGLGSSLISIEFYTLKCQLCCSVRSFQW